MYKNIKFQSDFIVIIIVNIVIIGLVIFPVINTFTSLTTSLLLIIKFYRVYIYMLIFFWLIHLLLFVKITINEMLITLYFPFRFWKQYQYIDINSIMQIEYVTSKGADEVRIKMIENEVEKRKVVFIKLGFSARTQFKLFIKNIQNEISNKGIIYEDLNMWEWHKWW